MIPGMFRRERSAFLAAWLIGPLVIIALVYVPSRVYCARLNRQLGQEEAVLKDVPGMHERVQRARAVSRKFAALPPASADVSTEYTVLLNHAAREHGFDVRSAVIDKNIAATKPGLRSFRIVLQGEGTLTSLAKLFHSLENSDHVFSVDHVRLGVTGLGPGARYSGDIVLQCHVLSL
jgi:hypothetical protein